MRDVRLLTLYKQHYLDDYKNPLKCQYTCWGYYDGIDIDKVENSTYSSLFEKRSQAPISELWYSTGKKIEKMNGGYSNQNIGIFRCVSDEKRCGKAAKFWKEMDSMPFIAIGLIKLVDRSDYDKVSLHIEEYVDEDEEKLCRALAYCTYDNADLVVLLQGNNIPKIESILDNGIMRSEKKSKFPMYHNLLTCGPHL